MPKLPSLADQLARFVEAGHRAQEAVDEIIDGARIHHLPNDDAAQRARRRASGKGSNSTTAA